MESVEDEDLEKEEDCVGSHTRSTAALVCTATSKYSYNWETRWGRYDLFSTEKPMPITKNKFIKNFFGAWNDGKFILPFTPHVQMMTVNTVATFIHMCCLRKLKHKINWWKTSESKSRGVQFVMWSCALVAWMVGMGIIWWSSMRWSTEVEILYKL